MQTKISLEGEWNLQLDGTKQGLAVQSSYAMCDAHWDMYRPTCQIR
ncbi:hypothetical protein [Paenibacillus sp.]|nr:hypothetical protein [Paenibacillus sp.]